MLKLAMGVRAPGPRVLPAGVRRRHWPALLLTIVACLSATLAHGQQMAVTFDDLPAHGDMPPGMSRLEIAQSILATLQREQMPPSYGFINGKKTLDDGASLAVLKAWVAAGNPLGNHTWEHQDLNHQTAAQFIQAVEGNEPLLKSLMGDSDWHWFRYPFLHEGDSIAKRRQVRRWLAAHGYKIAEVNMDFEDYLWNAPYARCVAKHDAAAIHKLHDSYLATADQFYGVFRQLSSLVYGRDVKYVLLLHVGAFDAKMLPELLSLYRSKGVKFVSLSKAMSDPAYLDDADIGEPNGGSQLELMMEKKKIPFPKNSKPYDELANLCR